MDKGGGSGKQRVSTEVKGTMRKRVGMEPQVIEKSLPEWACRLLLTGTVYKCENNEIYCSTQIQYLHSFIHYYYCLGG